MKEFKEETIIESSLEALAFNTQVSRMLFDEVQSDMTKNREVLCTVAGTHPSTVLVKGHIQGPVQVVLNGPMGPDRLSDVFGIGG